MKDKLEQPKNKLQKLISKINIIMLIVGILGAVISLFYISTDVFFRYLFNRPVHGTIEMCSMFLAISAVCCFTPSLTENKHIKTNLFLDRFPFRLRNFLEGIFDIIGASIVGFATVCVFIDSLHTYEYGDLTDVLLVPIAPFKFTFTICLGIFAILLFFKGLQNLNKSEEIDK